MNEYTRLKNRAKSVKAQYPKGTRVQLIRMDDPQAPNAGTFGTVMYVDDIGTIHVLWDTGCTLGITDADECRKV